MGLKILPFINTNLLYQLNQAFALNVITLYSTYHTTSAFSQWFQFHTGDNLYLHTCVASHISKDQTPNRLAQ